MDHVRTCLFVWGEMSGIISSLLFVRSHTLVTNTTGANTDHTIVSFGRFEN